MGKKKAKDPQQTPQSNGLRFISFIFNTLFGNTLFATASLFSDFNPFRRKPQQHASVSYPTIPSQSPNNGGSGSHDSGEDKKRKRKNNKEERPILDSDSVTEASEKKSKRGSDEREGEGEGKDHNLGTQTKKGEVVIEGEEGKMKEKKRKREELEKEWEEKNNKEERPILDSDSVTEASEKKSKRGSDEREGEGEGEDHNLGTQTKKGEVVIEGEEGKMKEKKRKREELEKEWEEKKYGVVVEGEEDEKERFGNKTLESKRKMIYNPADMLVSKEGYDDEDKLLRTILVGNLPLKLKKKTLLKEFKKFGEVESLVTRSVPIQDTKKPRKGAIHSKKINDSADSVHAYIVFKTEESAQASLSHNMTVVEGNHIRVDRACPPRKKHKVKIASLYDNKRTVFVGNLPFDVKDEELYQLFCGISNLESSIEAVRVIRDPHLNVGKGIAYVLFKTREAANFAVKKRSLKLRDRKLKICHARICRAKADATPSKRPNPSPAPSTPAKKLAVASRSPSNSNNKSNKKTNASYQGLHATKSDINKKVHGREKRKERMTKRAAVAAKKAKAKLFKDGGTPKQAGVKRMLDRRTPDSSLRNKKGGTPKQAGVKRKLDSRTPDSSLRNKKAKKNNR